MTRLGEHYRENVQPALLEKFGYQNPMQVPRITKIVVSMGVGSAVETKSRLDLAAKDLTQITGQKAAIRRARRSVANFRLREGTPIGCMVTLRSQRMYEFFDRVVSVVLPRIRDFRGMPDKFDGRGNYNFGLTEQALFPEIDLDKVEHTQGMNVTVVTNARTDEEARALLDCFSFPFRRQEDDN